MINQEDITIIIPHLGETEEQEYSLDECLKSLNETVPDIKKIVVKNGYGGDGAELCHGNITLDEQGQCKAVNAAVATTNTPWIFITNDDMVYAPGWFQELFSIDVTDWKCASPKLVEPRPGAPTFEVFFAGGAGGDFDKQKFLDYVKTPPLLTWKESYKPGFNFPLLIKRELWNTIGGYDINYDPWGSNGDSDLEYKIKLAGVQPMQSQFSRVYHFSQTSGTFEPRNDEFRNKNYAYFKEKWGFDRTDDGIWEATFEIPNEGRKFRPEWEGEYGIINK
jgi:GT2 family glycosyltransferase